MVMMMCGSKIPLSKQLLPFSFLSFKEGWNLLLLCLLLGWFFGGFVCCSCFTTQCHKHNICFSFSRPAIYTSPRVLMVPDICHSCLGLTQAFCPMGWRGLGWDAAHFALPTALLWLPCSFGEHSVSTWFYRKQMASMSQAGDCCFISKLT